MKTCWRKQKQPSFWGFQTVQWNSIEIFFSEEHKVFFNELVTIKNTFFGKKWNQPWLLENKKITFFKLKTFFLSIHCWMKSTKILPENCLSDQVKPRYLIVLNQQKLKSFDKKLKGKPSFEGKFKPTPISVWKL